jgi:hypothetical protein
VDRAALNDNVTWLQVYDFVVFKFHVNHARQDNHVVRSLGTVCESRVAGRKFVNPERCAGIFQGG